MKDSKYTVNGDLEAVAEIGDWISKTLGKENASRAGRAVLAAKRRREAKEAKAEGWAFPKATRPTFGCEW